MKESDERLQMMWPEYSSLNSQSYPELLVSNGSFYWAKTAVFMQEKSFYGSDLISYKLAKNKALDIDTYDDYCLAIQRLDAAQLDK